MGSLLSKDSNKQEEVPPEKSTPTKPILTPNSRISELDPRSPSANICRTPIEICGTPIKAEFGGHDTFNLNSPGVFNKVLLDPRSPAVEFIRTPIVAQEKKSSILRNKNFDNVLFNDTPKQRKPKLLDSTPIKNLSKRKSFAGYLETNLDFVETNLDEVMIRKSLSNLCTKSEYTPVDSMVNRIDKDADDFICQLAKDNEDGLMLNHGINIEKAAAIQSILDDIIDDVFKIEDIKIDIIPRIVAISPKPRKIIKNFDKKIKDLIYEESQLEIHAVDNKEMIPETEEDKDKNNETAASHIPPNVGDPSNKLEAEVTNLAIDKIIPTPEEKRQIQANKNRVPKLTKKNTALKDSGNLTTAIKRVPLTDRNTSNKTRTIPKLRVHDKPRKSQYTVSKIPQFKGKRFGKLPQTQCENTPPPKNASVWDNEETLII